MKFHFKETFVKLLYILIGKIKVRMKYNTSHA